jgi:hypothetical protein
MYRFIGIVAVLLAFAEIGLAQTQELILPVALNGYVKPPIHYQTTLRIVNLSTTAVQVTSEAYQNDGSAIQIFDLFPIVILGTKKVFSIGPLGSVEAFTAEDVPDLNGWIRLTFDASANILATAEVSLINAPVGPHPICLRPSTEIITTVQVSAVTAAKKFGGVAVIRPNRTSGYAIVNPSTTQPATAYLSLFDPNALLVGSATIVIPPQGRVARLLSEYFPGAASNLMGSLRITASAPVAVGAVHVLHPEGKFVSLATQPLPALACAQVIAPARNPLTNECLQFPTPCDVPEGWQPVQSCGK